VERIGTRFGLFPEWGFAISPVAVVSLAVEHDPRFTVNGFETSTGRQTSKASDYAVLVPGSYVFGHDSMFLRADRDTVLASTVGSTTDATVDVVANAEFHTELDAEVHKSLAACTTQHVLFPTGCPFGQRIDDRIVSDPLWTMKHYPTVSIDPSSAFGVWEVFDAPGTAHLKVDVESLFDGTVTTFDHDVPFHANYQIRLDGDALQVTAED
jgi:hypothetical protein